MNRKERRALSKQGPSGAPGPRPSPAAALLAEASQLQHLGKLDQAAKLYKRAAAVEPDNGAALNSLACVLLDLGQRDEAAARFAQSIALVPEIFEEYQNVLDTLFAVNPPLREAMARAAQAWPRLLSVGELFGPAGITAIAGDPLLRCVLELATIREINLEYVMTSVRTALLDAAVAMNADGRTDEKLFMLFCALARQCFINEYVFAITSDEADKAAALRARLDAALAADAPVAPLWLVAVAAYGPLGELKSAAALRARKWPQPLRDVIRQQIDEPHEEREIAASVAALTPIEDEISQRVRQQYEENPYPRWVSAATRRAPMTVGEYLQRQFPSAPAWTNGDGKAVDMLIAGCGTGRQSIETAALFRNVRVLAVDLSLASLAYARRKTREVGVTNIDYAQADILNLGTIGRTFDMIAAGGVLHHMADPMQGWRVLVSLLRPGGLMQLAFYSEIGRRDVVAARALIASRGFQPTPDGIRGCRRELSLSPARRVARFYDFFSTSECRDLLFHVQEHRIGIPDIKAFITANGLSFVGFALSDPVRRAYAARFPDDRAMTNLDHWHAFETANPDTFTGMYQFWVRRVG
jgi:SAM-dependent methyltransferase